MSILVNDTDEMRGQASIEDMEAEARASAEYVITGFGSSGEVIEPIFYATETAAVRDARHFRDEGWRVRVRRVWR